MTDPGKDRGGGNRPSPAVRAVRLTGFPVAMLLVYGVTYLAYPAQAVVAIDASGRVAFQAAPALAIAFAVMVVLNLVIRPEHIRQFLGGGATVAGTLLTLAAGILSMGPIYAWYPLLRDLRGQGASDFHLAAFLGSRAVKPPLLPLMVAYFGWVFTVVLSLVMVAGAVVTGGIVAATAPWPRED